jgi:hypothetical protein
VRPLKCAFLLAESFAEESLVFQRREIAVSILDKVSISGPTHRRRGLLSSTFVLREKSMRRKTPVWLPGIHSDD